jgi:DNA-binding CsgD family transcriptional regulator
MISRIDIPWFKINDFLLDCGKVCHPREFCIHLLRKLYSLVPYDEGMVCFLDATGAIIDEFLLNMDPQIIRDYKEYYSKLEDGRYSISARIREKKVYNSIQECVHDWSMEENNEFVADYVRPQGIRYSLGLALCDINDSVKSVCIINRIRQAKFCDAEMRIMATIFPHLRNLHRNLFFKTMESDANANSALSCLTARESEIVALLCKGIGPQRIGRDLFISRATVYRHIANIYNKLDVSSIQELMVKTYNRPASLPSNKRRLG